MVANFHIDDGMGADPWWRSRWLHVRQTKADLSDPYMDAYPGGDYQNPRSESDTNYGYVRVEQHGDYAAEVARLELFVARGGPEFISHDDSTPWNDQLEIVEPPIDWATITGNKVVRIRWEDDFGGLHNYLDFEANTGMVPTDGTKRWYQFKWEKERVPPAVGFHPCLLGRVWAPDDPDQAIGFQNVVDDDNFAQRNIAVDPAKRGKTITRSLTLGNQKSIERRLGLLVKTSGPASQGAKVQLRLPGAGKLQKGAKLVETLSVIDRLAVPKVVPFQPSIPRSVWFRRLPRRHGLVALRDFPPAWGVKYEEGMLSFTGSEGGLSLPIHPGELIDAEFEVLVGPEGNQMTLEVAQFNGNGRVVGGYSFEFNVED